MQCPKQCKYWSNEIIKILLDARIEEMNTIGINGASLYRQFWVRLGRERQVWHVLHLKRNEILFRYFKSKIC